MTTLRARPAARVLLAAAGALLLAVFVGRYLIGGTEISTVTLAFAAVLGVGAALVVMWADPAWTLSAAVVLTIFSGNWQALGLPNNVTPDRFLLALSLLAVLARAPATQGRPHLRLRAVHWALGATAIYAIASAMVAGTLLNGVGGFRLLDRLGLFPFAIFLAAPLVFVTARDRMVLAGVLTVLGAYLGFVTLMDMGGVDALVWPQYVLDPGVGTHVGRGRGVFVQAAVNGAAMFACAVAAAFVVGVARSVFVRAGAMVAIALCAVGIVLTTQRSVWLGSAVALVVTLLAFRPLRRWALPLFVAAGLAALVTLAAVPGFAEKARERGGQSETVRDRVNSNRAALNMLLDRPLTGFGWDTFTAAGRNHYELDPDHSLKIPKSLPVHNVFLGNLAELGLIGTGLWVVALILGVGGAILRRGPPELEPWRIGLLAIALQWFVVANASPVTHLFPNAMLWLVAGIAAGPYLRVGDDDLGQDPGGGLRPDRLQAAADPG
jgi:O-antigen ligase